MRFSRSIETQLTAAANAADRANRPTLLVLAPALLLVGAVVLTLVTYNRFDLAKRMLSNRLEERETVDQLIAYAEDLEAAHPDIGMLFPPNPFMGANIEDVKNDVWGEDVRVNVGPKSNPRPVGLTREIVRSDVEVGIQEPVPAEELFRFIHRVLTDPNLSGVFLAKINITPRAGGWLGSVAFRLYERAQ